MSKDISKIVEIGPQSNDSLADTPAMLGRTSLAPLHKPRSSKSVQIDDDGSNRYLAPPKHHDHKNERPDCTNIDTKITITSNTAITETKALRKITRSSDVELAVNKSDPLRLSTSRRWQSVAQRITLSVTSPKYQKESLSMLKRKSTDVGHAEFPADCSFYENGINSMSAFYVMAQFVISIVYTTELWYIPLEIGFGLEVPVAYSCVVLFFHTADCGLEFMTKRPSFAEKNKGCKLSDWQKYYLTHEFAIDFITTIPFELIPIEHRAYLWAIKYLRLYKLPRILSTSPVYKEELKRIQKAFGIGQGVILILPLSLVFCYFLHFQACAIFLGGRLANFTNNDIEIYRDLSLSRQYTWSLFAAVGNVFQVGYRPVNIYEQWLVVTFIIIGAAMYASVIAAISSLAVSFDASGSLYRQKIDELQEYMNWKGLEDTTRQKILKYYDLKYRGKYFEEGTLLNDMNDSLRMEIAAHNCRDLISKVSFLRREQNDGRDELFLGKIATALVPCYFVVGDILFTQGQPGSEMFFIQQGTVNVLVQGKHVATLSEGLFFGDCVDRKHPQNSNNPSCIFMHALSFDSSRFHINSRRIRRRQANSRCHLSPKNGKNTNRVGSQKAGHCQRPGIQSHFLESMRKRWTR
ncbi:hypothetical protein BDR26DRAFT_536200 [Obelidium mucronatum]|nr:hypothetical protein BDR26DRAFT_536200 [Obelidium mucronatum]